MPSAVTAVSAAFNSRSGRPARNARNATAGSSGIAAVSDATLSSITSGIPHLHNSEFARGIGALSHPAHWLRRRRRLLSFRRQSHRLTTRTENCARRECYRTINNRRLLTKRPFSRNAWRSATSRCHPNTGHAKIISALSPEDEQMTAERIGTNYLLRLHLRPNQVVKPIAQINRPTREKDFRARRQR